MQKGVLCTCIQYTCKRGLIFIALSTCMIRPSRLYFSPCFGKNVREKHIFAPIGLPIFTKPCGNKFAQPLEYRGTYMI